MSADSLNYCANSGLISELIEELTGDDVLVRYVDSEIVFKSRLYLLFSRQGSIKKYLKGFGLQLYSNWGGGRGNHNSVQVCLILYC